MKFVVARADLVNLLTKLQNVIGQKATLPILSNVLVEALGNEVTLTATDLTVGIKGTCEAKVSQPGATTLPARKLTQLIRELTVPTLEIVCHAGDITEIHAGASKFKIHGMSRADFPSLPDLHDAVTATLDACELKNCLYRTAFAVSREDNRYVLTGVLLQVEEGRATFVGTDGKRLAKAHMAFETSQPVKGSYILPIKAVDELLKVLEDSGTVRAFLTSDKIGIQNSHTLLITKLLAGEFPDFMRVIPKKSETIVSLHREELTSLLRQVSLFTADSSQSVKFSLHDQELRLAANTMDIGEGKVSMPINYTGGQMDIAFNPAFFLDILRHCQTEVVYLGVNDRFNPGVLFDMPGDSPEINMQETPLFVLMPMRLEDEA